MRMRFVRRVSFSAAVKFPNPAQAPEFGASVGAEGLGFNYGVEAHVEGEVDPLTGMIMNLMNLDEALKEVVGALDHRVLNELAPFIGRVPTAELLAAHVFAELDKKLNDQMHGGAKARAHLAQIVVHENDALSASVRASL